jgi:hypothetical protein
VTDVEKDASASAGNVPPQPDQCPRCGGTALRPALRPSTKSRLVLGGEVLFTAAAIAGIVYKSVPFAIAAVAAAVATFAVTLRSRQLVCEKCGWNVAQAASRVKPR